MSLPSVLQTGFYPHAQERLKLLGKAFFLVEGFMKDEEQLNYSENT